MANELSIFEQKNLPSHIADFLNEESNIDDRASVPSLSYEGKVWTISVNGEKTTLMKRDDDGEQIPVSVFQAFILDFGKQRGRQYYEGTYNKTQVSMPVCWSDDGVKPNPRAEKIQAPKCEGCPMSIKGSKVSDNGIASAACSQHRMVALVPAKNLDFTPLRLKLAITSLWDKQSPDNDAQGWFAFDNYTDMLRAKGIKHTAAVVTKMKLDPGAQYPKVIFSPARWATPEEQVKLKELIHSEEVKKLVSGSWTPNGVDGKAVASDDDAGPSQADKLAAVEAARVEAARQKAAAEAAEKAAAAEKAKEEAAAAKAAKAAEKAATKAKSEVAEKAAQKHEAAGTKFLGGGDDDDDGDIVLPGSSKGAAAKDVTPPKTTTASAAPASDVPDDVSDLLQEWGD